MEFENVPTHTVIIIDQTHRFSEYSSELIELPAGPRRTSLVPLRKTLWTSAVEATFEYARIPLDVLPDQHSVIFHKNNKYLCNIRYNSVSI